MTMKAITARISEDMAEWLARDGGNGGRSLNQGVIYAIETLQAMRQASLRELKGLLTSDEWKFLADIFNGALTPAPLRCSTGVLAARIEDAEDEIAERWHIDKQQLEAKIQKLTGAQVDALYSRIEDYWEDLDGVKEDPWEEWAKY